MVRPLIGDNGTIRADQVSSAIREGSDHAPRSAVVAIENTHNSAGGRVFPLEEAQAIAKVCDERGVAVHLDGARLFNAQAATGISAKEWAACADTLTFCFSKGLGAPIGSMVCSTTDRIAAAHRLRKRLGGGMRQVGVIAAAARVALETGPERLIEDHVNARRLAEGLSELHHDAVDPSSVETNMVYLNLTPFSKGGPEVVSGLLSEGVLTIAMGQSAMRLVTHRDVSSQDVEVALSALGKVLSA
jgi:threonine aldolase